MEISPPEGIQRRRTVLFDPPPRIYPLVIDAPGSVDVIYACLFKIGGGKAEDIVKIREWSHFPTGENPFVRFDFTKVRLGVAFQVIALRKVGEDKFESVAQVSGSALSLLSVKGSLVLSK